MSDLAGLLLVQRRVPCRHQGNVVTSGEHVTEGKHAETPSLEEGGR
jgi:hypothetical protein